LSTIDWNKVDAMPLADKPDEDAPELDSAWFKSARPAKEVLPELFGEQLAVEMLKPKSC
jgi:uncharacterized protein (DUF4415 family)